MILTDEINVLESVSSSMTNGHVMTDDEISASWYRVPARVDYRSTNDNDPDGRAPWSQEQFLVCVMEWQEFRGQQLSPRRHNIEWRGVRYPLDGLPLVRMRGTEPHHYTVGLQRVGA